VLTGWIGGRGIDAANPECHRPGSCTLMARVFWALGRMLGGPVGLVVEPGAGLGVDVACWSSSRSDGFTGSGEEARKNNGLEALPRAQASGSGVRGQALARSATCLSLPARGAADQTRDEAMHHAASFRAGRI